MGLERLFLLKMLKKSGRVFSAFFTFFVVSIAWVLFRADSIANAMDFYSIMFSPNFQSVDLLITPQLIVLLIASAFFSFWALIPRIEKWQMQLFTGVRGTVSLIALTLVALFLFVLGLSHVTAVGFNPFIYFRF
jgi:alginate O-acetyltransferase complex protein AlgI